MFSLNGKTALVTGAARGIGLGITGSLLACGASVMLVDADGRECAKATASLARKGRVAWAACDVTKRDEVVKAIAECESKLGPIDILVNNAGVYPFKPLLALTDEDWDHVLDVNLKGVFHFTQEAAKRMAARKAEGRIVSMTSIAAIQGYAGLAHYCASKGGIVAFTRAAALELAPRITVNAVAPGGVLTPGTSVMMADKKVLATQVAAIPIKRMGQPADIAAAVAYLCSNEASGITGQTIVVDGDTTIA